MSINMRTLYGSITAKGGWDLGETKKLPVAPNKGIFQYNGMTLVSRDAVRFINATDYPAYYALTDGYYPDTFFKTRTPSSNGIPSFTQVNHADSYGGVMIAVGNGGKIGRSTDGGATFTQITSPIANDLWFVHYASGLGKWIIFYTNNKALISSDNGLTFVDTTITGLPFSGALTNNTYLKIQTLGNNTVIIKGTNGNAFMAHTSTLTSWSNITDPSTLYSLLPANSIPRLSSGNGWFVIMMSAGGGAYSLGTTRHIMASQTGAPGSWTHCSSVASGDVWAAAESWAHAPVWDGTQWFVGVGGPVFPATISSFPKTGPAPGPTDYYQSSVGANAFHYTTGVNKDRPTGNWTTIGKTIGGYYITGWGYVGGNTYWSSSGGGAAYLNGPSEAFGTYLAYGAGSSTGYTNTGMELYNRDVFSQILAAPGQLNSANPGTAVSGGATGIWSQLPQAITADKGIVKSFNSSVSFDSSNSTSAPGRSLPAFTGNVYTGEGTNCTRIK